MIKEFAVEPRIMAKWEHFQSLWEDFGVGKGRLISKYPITWVQKVAELAKGDLNTPGLSKPVRANAIASKLYAEQHKFFVSSRRYNLANPWLANAEAQAGPESFHCIVAEANPRNRAGVVVAGDFDKGVAPYRVETTCEVVRSAAALAGCAELLLCNCDEIQLVDPNFDPAEPRFVDTFEAVVALNNSVRGLRVLEIHTERKPAYDRSNREHHLRRTLGALIPRGVTLRAYFWSRRADGRRLHARFLLTELGGVQYDLGLDTGNGPADTTLVTLMDHAVWQAERANYRHPSTAFDISPDCIIPVTGTG